MCSWADLPDILLEDIYTHLSIRDRYHCSMVCYNWYAAFYNPRIWRRLVVEESQFTYTRMNLLGSEVILSQERLQRYLGRFGKHIRYISVPSTLDFHYLYDFFMILVAYLEFFEDYPMPNLYSFDLVFACESRVPVVGPVVLGTGGRLLEKITELIGNLRNLRLLQLNNLLLEFKDVPGLLEIIVDNGQDCLRHFEVLNLSKERCPLFQIARLHNLTKLVISPPQISDDVILMIAKNTDLEELVLVQDKYTLESDSLAPATWVQVQKLKPHLHVFLEIRGRTKSHLVLQERAPVYGIIYSTPYEEMNTPKAFIVSENYRGTLRIFGHTTLPRKHGSKSFHSRGDSGLVLLVRECRFLETLIIRERISTATLLILAFEGTERSLRSLFVRRNAVLLRCDWPKPFSWTDERYSWLKKVSMSYDMVEDEISLMFGKKWQMMTDADFKNMQKSF